MSIKAFKDEMSKAKGGGGTMVKLGNNEKVVGCFVGEACIYYNVYDQEKNSGAQYLSPVAGAKTRFKWNFAVRSGADLDMQIWDGSPTVGSELAEYIEKYGQNTWFEITRKGLKLDTRYLIMFEGKLTEDEVKQVADLDEFDLTKYLEDPTDLSDSNEVPLPTNDEEIPF